MTVYRGTLSRQQLEEAVRRGQQIAHEDPNSIRWPARRTPGRSTEAR
jgi:hypothetical protein